MAARSDEKLAPVGSLPRFSNGQDGGGRFPGLNAIVSPVQGLKLAVKEPKKNLFTNKAALAAGYDAKEIR